MWARVRFWFDSSSSHSFSYETPVAGGTGIQYVLTSTSQASPITVTSSTTVTGSYTTQHHVTVISAHDSPTPSQWVDKGGSLTASVTSPDDNGAGTRYLCTGHKIDDGSLRSGTRYTFTNIQAPHQIEFQWTPQYRLTVNTDPPVFALQPDVSRSGFWHELGALVACTARFVNGYDFDYWIFDGVPQEAGNMALVLTMDMSHNATAHYTATTDLNLDGRVDEADIPMIASAFHSKIGEKDYDPRMDFDDNGIINIIDIYEVARDFEKTT